MNGGRATTQGAYARSIEQGWERLCGRAVILSRRDWELVRAWYERGIPLQIVEEAIDAAAERRARGRTREAGPPRGLSYIAAAVEEAWNVVLEGRLGEPGPERSESEQTESGIEAWRRRLGSEPPGTPLRDLLQQLIADHGRANADELDARLDGAIVKAAPAAERREVEAALDRDLEAYRERMTPEVYRTTRQRALVLRLRERFGLPALACEAGNG